jgi:Tripartite tricarboxylate transporter TctB family/Tripartite tricarboxylate transporter family receptor
MIAKAAGVDPRKINYVAYSGGGEAAVSLMGGNVSAGISGFGEWKPYVDSGRLRYLAVSSDERVSNDSPPTIRESGLYVSVSNWRAVVSPRGVDAATRSWLADAMSRMRQTNAWQEVLRRNDWTDHFLAGPELDRFIEKETASDAEVLASIGIVSGEDIASYAAVGPWAFPMAIAIGLLLSAVGAVYDRPGAHRAPLQLIDWRTVAAFAAVLAGYVILLEPIGYLLSTFVLMLIIPPLLGSRRMIRNIVFSAVTSVAVYAFFNLVLKVGLPSGVLG